MSALIYMYIDKYIDVTVSKDFIWKNVYRKLQICSSGWYIFMSWLNLIDTYIWDTDTYRHTLWWYNTEEPAHKIPVDMDMIYIWFYFCSRGNSAWNITSSDISCWIAFWTEIKSPACITTPIYNWPWLNFGAEGGENKHVNGRMLCHAPILWSFEATLQGEGTFQFDGPFGQLPLRQLLILACQARCSYRHPCMAYAF